MQDILDHPTFEFEFSDVAKGLPDLERIVSRIHAKNCRVTDFLKVLAVRGLSNLLLLWIHLDNWALGIQEIEQGPLHLGRYRKFVQVQNHSRPAALRTRPRSSPEAC